MTEWHNIVLWRGLAEVAEKYLHKGDQVYIEGKLRTRQWEKDGVTRYSTEIVGENLTMLGGRPRTDGASPVASPAAASSNQLAAAPATPAASPEATSSSQPAATPATDSSPAEVDDLPF